MLSHGYPENLLYKVEQSLALEHAYVQQAIVHAGPGAEGQHAAIEPDVADDDQRGVDSSGLPVQGDRVATAL